MSGARRCALLLAAVPGLAAAPSPAARAAVPPRPTRYATDRTGRLDGTRMAALNEKLAAFERETSTQVLVYVDARVPAGTTLEEFANQAFHDRGVGQKGKDNGALFVAFLDDRLMRLEVGYGLEGAIPDARAKQITSDVVKPRFKNGDYVGGIEAAATQVMATARGEAYAGTGRTVAEAGGRDTGFPWKAFAIVLGVAFGIGGLATLAARKDHWYDALFTLFGVGSFFSGVGLFMVGIFFMQERIFRLALLAGAVFLSGRLLEEALPWLGKTADDPPAVRWLRRLAFCGLPAILLALPFTPWPITTAALWVPVAAAELLLLLVLASNALDTGSGWRGLLWPMAYMGGLALVPMTWERLHTGALPMQTLYAFGGLVMLGTLIRPGGWTFFAGAGGSGSSSGSSSESWSSGSSSSDSSWSSSSSDSSSSFSGGGGDSGGGGSSDSW